MHGSVHCVSSKIAIKQQKKQIKLQKARQALLSQDRSA